MKRTWVVLLAAVMAMTFVADFALAAAGGKDRETFTVTTLTTDTITVAGANERSFDLPLASAFIVGTGVIGNDGTTAPGLAITDNVIAIVYASSAESGSEVQWGFSVPSDYGDGMGFRVMVSSSTATATDKSVAWQIWSNADDTGFDAAAVGQTAVSLTSATLDASNEVVTLDLDATGDTMIVAGRFINLDIWPGGASSATTEIKGVQGYYRAAR